MAETNGIMEIDGRRTALTIAKTVAVALVVGLFSAFYCWGFWDPAGAMKHVPVGIVNLDEGAVANGEDVNLGADMPLKAMRRISWSWMRTLSMRASRARAACWYSRFRNASLGM